MVLNQIWKGPYKRGKFGHRNMHKWKGIGRDMGRKSLSPTSQGESSVTLISLTVLRRNQPCWHLNFGLLAFRTRRSKILMSSHWVLVLFNGRPTKLIKMAVVMTPKIERQTLSTAFSKTTTVSYLLTELWSFFRYQEEIPWSQKRSMLSLKWDEHMTLRWLKSCTGKLLGILRKVFFPLIRGAQEGAALPFAALHLKLWSGSWEDAEPDAAAAASERADTEEAESITETLNWSGALISLICWINSSDCLHPDCFNNEKKKKK